MNNQYIKKKKLRKEETAARCRRVVRTTVRKGQHSSVPGFVHLTGVDIPGLYLFIVILIVLLSITISSHPSQLYSVEFFNVCKSLAVRRTFFDSYLNNKAQELNWQWSY